MSNRLVVAALAVALAGSAFAAPPESHLLPPDQHSSEKARGLARRYADALRELNTGIYHCLPWLVVPNNSIGFFKPKHLASDARYLSLRVFVEQDASPQFTALDFEGRASAMYSRYVGEMLRRMTRDASLRADADVDGFSVIIGWLKQTTHGYQTGFAFLSGALVVSAIVILMIGRYLSFDARAQLFDKYAPPA